MKSSGKEWYKRAEKKWYECAKRLKNGNNEVWYNGKKKTLVLIGMNFQGIRFYEIEPDDYSVEVEPDAYDEKFIPESGYHYEWDLLKFSPPKRKERIYMMKTYFPPQSD